MTQRPCRSPKTVYFLMAPQASDGMFFAGYAEMRFIPMPRETVQP